MRFPLAYADLKRLFCSFINTPYPIDVPPTRSLSLSLFSSVFRSLSFVCMSVYLCVHQVFLPCQGQGQGLEDKHCACQLAWIAVSTRPVSRCWSRIPRSDVMLKYNLLICRKCELGGFWICAKVWCFWWNLGTSVSVLPPSSTKAKQVFDTQHRA